MEKTIKLRQNLCWYYCAFIFSMLPLFFINMYFNISEEKWMFFTVSSSVFIGLSLLLLLAQWYREKSPKEIRLTLFDLFLWLFLAANVISLVLSENPKESILGANSRHHGFLNILLYVLLIILIKTAYTEHRQLMSVLSLVGGLASLAGVCQYLSFDPLGMYKGVNAASVHRMISTIGNMNIFAAYLNIVTPLTLLLFMRADKKKDMLLFGACFGLDAAAGVASTSDGFYLGTSVSIILLLCLGVLKLKELRRLFLALSVALLCDLALLLAADHIRRNNIILSSSLKSLGISIRPSSGFTKLLETHTPLLFVTALIMLGLYFLLAIPEKKAGDTVLPEPVLSKYLMAALLAVLLGTVVFAVLAYPFKENMGSYRGFIWNLAIEDFSAADLKTKLFGYGQETVLEIYRLRYRDLMVDTTGVIYDNVHCQPLQYLVTTGFFGLASYLCLIGCIVTSIIKRVRKNPGLSLLLVPIVSYFVQSFVNIAQSATTPIFFILIGLAAGAMKEDN